jgi:hypothetical protein
MAETNLQREVQERVGRLRCMDGQREERYGAVLTVVSEGEVEPWIVVRGVHDAR